jgi:hypothetical protein
MSAFISATFMTVWRGRHRHMSGSFAARENMTMALDDAADLLREHGQHEWATFLQDVIDHAEDDAALARLRRAYDELTDLILDPADADADFLFQQRLGHAWVNLERLSPGA